jgi:hypothetical protein
MLEKQKKKKIKQWRRSRWENRTEENFDVYIETS